MLIPGHEYKMNFTNVAIKMLTIADFIARENLLREVEKDNANLYEQNELSGQFEEDLGYNG